MPKSTNISYCENTSLITLKSYDNLEFFQISDKGFILNHNLGGFRYFLAIALFVAGQSVFAQSPVRFEEIKIVVGGIELKVELAQNPAQRQTGLMFRKSLPPSGGMWFEFDQPERHCMWMKNTYVDLSVAFVDSAGKIINIENMKAKTLDRHCANKPAAYALEVAAGWFAAHDIKPGAYVSAIK